MVGARYKAKPVENAFLTISHFQNQLVAGPLGHPGRRALFRALAPSTHLCAGVQECARADDPPPAWERPLKSESVSA